MLDGAEKEDARAFEAAVSALDQLAELRRAGLAKGLDARRLHDTLAELPVRLGERSQPDRVLVATPEQIRARRFEAVFVCGLQEGEFPRGASPRAVPAGRGPAGDREGQRARAARARGRARARALPLLRLRLARRARALPQLALQRRGGQPAARLVLPRGRQGPVHRDRAAPALPVRRGLGRHRTRPPRWSGSARSRRSAPRSELAGPDGLTAAELLERLGGQDAFSASALETFADCPVKWLVDRLLRPEALEPDPEQMVRGQYAHDVLELHPEPPARAQRRPPRHAREPPRGGADTARGAARETVDLPALAEADARARGGAATRVRPAALPAPRGGARRGVRAGRARAALRHA